MFSATLLLMNLIGWQRRRTAVRFVQISRQSLTPPNGSIIPPTPTVIPPTPPVLTSDIASSSSVPNSTEALVNDSTSRDQPASSSVRHEASTGQPGAKCLSLDNANYEAISKHSGSFSSHSSLDCNTNRSDRINGTSENLSSTKPTTSSEKLSKNENLALDNPASSEKRQLSTSSEKHPTETSNSLENLRHNSVDISAAERRGNLANLPAVGRQRTIAGKPPNVVVYCGKADSRRMFEGVKATLGLCVNPDRYAIYHLKHEAVKSTPWADNAALLVVSSEKTYDGIDTAFVNYFLRGGTLISFASALDARFVRREDTAALRPGVSRLRYRDWDNVTTICGRYRYTPHVVAELSGVQLTALGTEAGGVGEGVGGTLIMEAIHEPSGGVAILSQASLDKDPSDMAISTEVFTALKQSNTARFEILRSLFSCLGLDCDQLLVPPTYTPLYLLSTNQAVKSSFLDSVKPRLKSGRLVSSGATTLVFNFDSKLIPVDPSGGVVSVVTDGEAELGAAGFDMERYRRSLATRSLGNVVLYGDVVMTTMTLLGGLMFSAPDTVGLVAVAGCQTAGQGRRGNVWLSPRGCAMFTLHACVALSSCLGARMSYVQHATALAVVLAVRRKPGYESIDVRIKWPNDIYFGRTLKLGGVIVKASVIGDRVHANIGCGLNVENGNPTICINDLISQHNSAANAKLEPFSIEELIGRSITELERLIGLFEVEGLDAFLRLYYEYWLHSGAEVGVGSESGPRGTVLGLDDFGYLSVRLRDGSIASLLPDDNGFDMMRGLIVQKHAA